VLLCGASPSCGALLQALGTGIAADFWFCTACYDEALPCAYFYFFPRRVPSLFLCDSSI
jgi:hypothetical protein